MFFGRFFEEDILILTRCVQLGLMLKKMRRLVSVSCRCPVCSLIVIGPDRFSISSRYHLHCIGVGARGRGLGDAQTCVNIQEPAVTNGAD